MIHDSLNKNRLDILTTAIWRIYLYSAEYRRRVSCRTSFLFVLFRLVVVLNSLLDDNDNRAQLRVTRTVN